MCRVADCYAGITSDVTVRNRQDCHNNDIKKSILKTFLKKVDSYERDGDTGELESRDRVLQGAQKAVGIASYMDRMRDPDATVT